MIVITAAVLRMSVPCFKLLVHGARAGLRGIARRGSSANGNGNGAMHSTHARAGLGVICRLEAAELMSIRDQLLRGLEW